MDASLDTALDAVAVLAEPVRRRLYELVVAVGEPVGRDDAAEAVGISRSLAAFHLDRLVEAGMLTVTYRRLSGRTGPGAGRPNKLYGRSDREIQVSLPARRYELAASVFATALLGETAEGTAGAVEAAASDVGRALGTEARRRVGRRRSRAALRAAAAAVLAEAGFEPATDGDGVLVLRNCPFDALARAHRDLVCGMNLSLMAGVIQGLRMTGIEAALDPKPGSCCVVLRSSKTGVGATA
jgi:predicted ArsR family transcriptional regulator